MTWYYYGVGNYGVEVDLYAIREATSKGMPPNAYVCVYVCVCVCVCVRVCVCTLCARVRVRVVYF